MNLPSIEAGKIIVVLDDFNTGITLNSDGSMYLSEGNNYYQIFENIDVARKYAENEIQKKKGGRTIEISLYNYRHEFLEIISPKQDNLVTTSHRPTNRKLSMVVRYVAIKIKHFIMACIKKNRH